MRPAELLVRLQEAGCRVVAEGNTLRVRGLLDDDLRYEIRKHKEELLEILRSPGESAGASTCTRVAIAGGESRAGTARALEPFGRRIQLGNRSKTGAKHEQACEPEPKKAGGLAPDPPKGRVEFVGNCPVLIVNGIDPLDLRRDPKTGRWIHDPGWWRSISRRGVLHDNAEGEQDEQ